MCCTGELGREFDRRFLRKQTHGESLSFCISKLLSNYGLRAAHRCQVTRTEFRGSVNQSERSVTRYFTFNHIVRARNCVTPSIEVVVHYRCYNSLCNSDHVFTSKKGKQQNIVRASFLTSFSLDAFLVVAHIGRVKQDQSYSFKIGLFCSIQSTYHTVQK
jgi:hypothetical protein